MRLVPCLLACATLGAQVLAAQQPGRPAPASSQTTSSAPQLPSITLAPELARVLRDYEVAWNKGDGAALAALFAEDGYVLQNGKPPVRGRTGIQAAYQLPPGGQLKLRALSVATADTIGFIIGAYGYEPNADVGKFTLTLKRQKGGKWMIFSDIDNGSSPPRRGGEI